jgi:hypothetical protein
MWCQLILIHGWILFPFLFVLLGIVAIFIPSASQ